MSLERRSLGPLEVSVVGFGAAAISGEGGGYGFGDISTDEAQDLLHRALDAGITLYDTAPIYGFGLSEQRLGKAFRHRRDEVQLVSKSGLTWDRHQRVGVDNSPATTQRMLETSLRDLHTGFLDAYLIHWPDPNVDIRRPMEILVRAKEEGKVRAIGLSNTNPEELARARQVGDIDLLQGELNLFSRYPQEALFEEVRQQGMGFMAYGTFDKGILTGRVSRTPRDFDPSDVRSRAEWWVKADREPKYRALDALWPLLQEAGHTGLEMALAFVLGQKEVSTALCGMRNPSQLESTLEALEHLPGADIMEEIERRIQELYFQP